MTMEGSEPCVAVEGAGLVGGGGLLGLELGEAGAQARVLDLGDRAASGRGRGAGRQGHEGDDEGGDGRKRNGTGLCHGKGPLLARTVWLMIGRRRGPGGSKWAAVFCAASRAAGLRYPSLEGRVKAEYAASPYPCPLTRATGCTRVQRRRRSTPARHRATSFSNGMVRSSAISANRLDLASSPPVSNVMPIVSGKPVCGFLFARPSTRMLPQTITSLASASTRRFPMRPPPAPRAQHDSVAGNQLQRLRAHAVIEYLVKLKSTQQNISQLSFAC